MSSPWRLWGTPDAEEMYSDPADAYEAAVADGWEVGDGEELPLEEWTAHPVGELLPMAATVLEDVLERWVSEEVVESGWAAFEDASRQGDVVEAMQAALDLLGSRVAYRMADTLVATHAITEVEPGVPLLDGEPLYPKES